jgi:tetratricopeptide (TPR) repeat protein
MSAGAAAASATRWRAAVLALVALVLSLGSSPAAAQEGSAAAAAAAAAGGQAAPKDPEKLLSAAEREFRNKAYEASIRLYGEALASAPLSPSPAAFKAKAYYGRHKAYMSAQRMPAAINDLSAAIDADGAHVLAHLQRGNLQLLTGRCAEAARDYERVLNLDATKRDAHSRLPHARACATALERVEHAKRGGNWRMVRELLNEAMAENRATAAPSLLLARAEASLNIGEGEREEALADLARVLKLDGNNVRAYGMRGSALYLHGDYATARAHFQQGLKVDPEDAACKEGYRKVKAVVKAKESADAAAARGDFGLVIVALESGCSIDRGNRNWLRECLPRLARAYLRVGNRGAASTTARQAVSVDDELAEAHYVLGECHLQAEEYEEATREGKRAHELDRGNGDFANFAQRAEAALRQSKTKDYYKILGE